MAALLRQGTRRIGGSVLQRTQAAVTSPAAAEERRRLVPMRMTTDVEAQAMQTHRLKEELYEALSKSKVEKWRNRRLFQHLAVHVNPRPGDKQWHRLRVSKWVTNVVRTAGCVSCTCMLVLGLSGSEGYTAEKKKILLRLMKLEEEQSRLDDGEPRS